MYQCNFYKTIKIFSILRNLTVFTVEENAIEIKQIEGIMTSNFINYCFDVLRNYFIISYFHYHLYQIFKYKLSI